MKYKLCAASIATIGLLLLSPAADTGRAQSEFPLDPATLVARLAARVGSLERIDSGLSKSLLASLGAAEAAFVRGNVAAGVGSLRAFQSQVRAHRGINTGIFIYDADSLVGQAQVIVKVATEGTILFENPQLVYLGGTVVKHPKVYVTFWGTTWNDSPWNDLSADYAHERDFLLAFLDAIGGTPYLDTLEQYYEKLPPNYSEVHSSNDEGILKGWWIDTSPFPKNNIVCLNNDCSQVAYNIETKDVEDEALKSVNHFGYDPDAIYFIVTDRGRWWPVPNGPLAYHSSFKAPPLPQSGLYVDFPYQADFWLAKALHDHFGPPINGDWLLAYASAVSLVAFHELAEAINDPRYGDNPVQAPPYPSNFGWLDIKGAEIIDKCGDPFTQAPAQFNVGLVPFLVPQAWSNAAFNCVQQSP